MSFPIPSDFDEKARNGLIALGNCGALNTRVAFFVDDFFGRHPGLERTRLAEAFIAGLYLDHLSTAADSQSAAQPPTETKKVA